MQRNIIRPVYGNIILGKQGENEVREVRFDVPIHLIECGWTLNHRRATDAAAYPVPLTIDGGELVWTILSGDVAIPGRGQAELTCCGDNGEILKSKTYTTITEKAVESGADAPEPIVPYLAKLAQDAAKTEEHAAAAENSAQNAANNAEAAEQQAKLAKEYAEAAKEANVQSDWEQSDETAPDYVKNRTHYIDEKVEVIASGTAMNFLSETIKSPEPPGPYGSFTLTDFSYDMSVTFGETYLIQISDKEFEMQPSFWLLNSSAAGHAGFGLSNKTSGYGSAMSGEYPFVILYELDTAEAIYFNVENPAGSIYSGEFRLYLHKGTFTAQMPCEVKITKKSKILCPLEDMFIPDTIARKNEIPSALPNPKKLTFTGAVDASYDGSEALTVNIPSGSSGGSGGTDIALGMTGAAVGQIAKITAVDKDGKPTAWEPVDFSAGEREWKHIQTVILEEEVSDITVTEDENGEPFAFTEILIRSVVMEGADEKNIRTMAIWINGSSNKLYFDFFGRHLNGYYSPTIVHLHPLANHFMLNAWYHDAGISESAYLNAGYSTVDEFLAKVGNNNNIRPSAVTSNASFNMIHSSAKASPITSIKYGAPYYNHLIAAGSIFEFYGR